MRLRWHYKNNYVFSLKCSVKSESFLRHLNDIYVAQTIENFKPLEVNFELTNKYSHKMKSFLLFQIKVRKFR
jgi:hypothetical protein